jgi:hypothetical protein
MLRGNMILAYSFYLGRNCGSIEGRAWRTILLRQPVYRFFSLAGQPFAVFRALSLFDTELQKDNQAQQDEEQESIVCVFEHDVLGGCFHFDTLNLSFLRWIRKVSGPVREPAPKEKKYIEFPPIDGSPTSMQSDLNAETQRRKGRKRTWRRHPPSPFREAGLPRAEFPNLQDSESRSIKVNQGQSS